MEVFGFNEAAMDMDEYALKSVNAQKEMNEVARTMQQTAIKVASGKGLQVTGAGIAGIQVEEQGDAVEIGWSSRPNLHLYFHEVGTYKDPVRSHMRDAFEQHEQELLRRVQNAIT